MRLEHDRTRTKQTCLVVPAAHDKVDHLVAVEGVLVAHDAEGGEAPVDAVHAQVGGEVVRELIGALWECETTSRRRWCVYLAQILDVGDVEGNEQLVGHERSHVTCVCAVVVFFGVFRWFH